MDEPVITDRTVEIGLQLMRHGAPDVALAAAKSLGRMISSDTPLISCQELDGILPAMMKVPNALATSPSPCGQWFRYYL